MSKCPSLKRLRVHHSNILDDLIVAAETSIALNIWKYPWNTKVEVATKNLLTLHIHGNENYLQLLASKECSSTSLAIYSLGLKMNLAYVLTLFLKCFQAVSLTYKFSNVKSMNAGVSLFNYNVGFYFSIGLCLMSHSLCCL